MCEISVIYSRRLPMMKKKPHLFVSGYVKTLFLITVTCLVIMVSGDGRTAFCSEPPKPPPPNAEKLFQDAEKTAYSNEQEAIRLYKEGLSHKPDDWKARAALGGLYEKTGRLPEAIGEYQKYWTGTKTKKACVLFSRALSKAKFMFDAASVAEEGAKKFPSDPDLQLMAGEMFLNINAGKRAIPYLQSALKSKPGDAAGLSLLGKAYELDGNLAEAFKQYSLVLTINPKDNTAAEGRKRLKDRSVKAGRLLLFLPGGWLYSGRDILNLSTGQTILIDVKKGKTPKETAEQFAAGATPVSMFNRKPAVTDETLKYLAEQASKETKRNVTIEEIRTKLKAVTPGYTMETETIGPYKSILVHAFTDGAGMSEQFSRYVVSLTDGDSIISFLSDTGKPDPKTKDFMKGLTGRLIPEEGGK
jgi:thioredoxin-like negative regulator of GroEL